MLRAAFVAFVGWGLQVVTLVIGESLAHSAYSTLALPTYTGFMFATLIVLAFVVAMSLSATQAGFIIAIWTATIFVPQYFVQLLPMGAVVHRDQFGFLYFGSGCLSAFALFLMGLALKRRRFLGLLSKSSSQAVADDIREVASENSQFRANLPSFLTLEFIRLARMHRKAAFASLAGFIHASVLLHGFGKIGWLPGVPYLGLAENTRSYHSVVLATQTAIIALIFPVVFSFMSTSIERARSSPVRLRVYGELSGVYLGGLAGVSFLIGMVLQHGFGRLACPETTAAWTWLAIAALLWTLIAVFWFLRISFDFVDPDGEPDWLARYGLMFAWPSELQAALAAMHLGAATKIGHITISAGENESDSLPEVLINPYFTTFGTEEAAIELSAPSELIEIRFRIINWVVGRWLKASARMDRPEPVLGMKKDGPHIVFPLRVGAEYSGKVCICRQANGAHLTRLQRYLIRKSFVFAAVSARPAERVITATMIMEDFCASAVQAIREGNPIQYESDLNVLVSFHINLIESGGFTNSRGCVDNMALLQDPRSSFLSESFAQRWAGIYRDLFESGCKAIPVSQRYCESAAWIPYRLLPEKSSDIPRALAARILQIGFGLSLAVERWWISRVREDGVQKPHHTVAIQPPLQHAESYVAVRKKLAEAWEACIDYRMAEGASDTESVSSAEFCLEHLSLSSKMLSQAVSVGDYVGASYGLNIFLHWLGRINRGALGEDHSYLLTSSEFVSLDYLSDDPKAVMKKFISEPTWMPEEERATKVMHALIAAGLRNAWEDIASVLQYIFLIWSKSSSDRSLARMTVAAMRSGEAFPPVEADATPSVGDVFPQQYSDSTQAHGVLQSAQAWVVGVIRQCCIRSQDSKRTRVKLDELAEWLISLTEPEQMTGRLHGASGARDVSALKDGQIASLLSLLSNDAVVDEASIYLAPLEYISSQDYLAWERTRRHFKECLDRIPDLTAFEFGHIIEDLFPKEEQGADFDVVLGRASRFLGNILARMDQMQQAAIEQSSVDERRLATMAAAASSLAFSADTSVFPLPFFHIEYSADEKLTWKERSVAFRREKGLFTDPIRVQPAINEEEALADVTRDYVAAFVMSEVLGKLNIQPKPDLDEADYERTLIECANEIRQQGMTPMLLVSKPTEPKWLYDWTHRFHREPFVTPLGLRARKLEVQTASQSYWGHLEDIAIYRAPIQPMSSVLLPREAFKQLVFRRLSDGGFIQASFDPSQDDPMWGKLVVRFWFALRIETLTAYRLLFNEPKESGD